MFAQHSQDIHSCQINCAWADSIHQHAFDICHAPIPVELYLRYAHKRLCLEGIKSLIPLNIKMS